jgi:hypothetical protein
MVVFANWYVSEIWEMKGSDNRVTGRTNTAWPTAQT